MELGSLVFFWCFFLVQKTTVTKTFRRHSTPLPPAPPPPHSSLCCSPTHPSIHPSLSLITTLSLSPSIVGLLLSLVEFQPFSLRFFFKFHNFFVCFECFFCLFWVFFCLFVAPPLPADFYKDLKAERNELKEPPHPFPVLKKKILPNEHPSGIWWIALWVLLCLFLVVFCVCAYVRMSERVLLLVSI